MNRKAPIVSIVYVYFNTPEDLVTSVESIKSAIGTYPFEVIVVDNNSSESVPKSVLHDKNVSVIRNKTNKGYGAGLNVGIRHAKGELVVCVNPDVTFLPQSLSLLVKKITSDKTIGVIGPQVRMSENKVLPTVSQYPLFPINLVLYTPLKFLPLFKKIAERYHLSTAKNHNDAPALGGACLLFRKRVFEEIGGFDEQFFLYFEESDICKRLRDKGYKATYYKEAKVIHLVGRSLTDKTRIQLYFERSRFLFTKKYQGSVIALLSEVFIRSFSGTHFSLILLVSLSLFLHFYKITTEMMFIGDFARDMLAARDMLQTGNIPLLGIPSSVVWLHQGPLSIYFIGLSYLLAGFNPWIPAMFYGILGSVSVLPIYYLGTKLFNKYIGLLSSVVFVTSPLVIINHRIPYHTAPIAFFTAVFLLALYFFLKTERTLYLLLTGLLLGLLYQLELSNGVLFFLVLLLFVFQKISLTKRKIIQFVSSVGIGISPFILYDLSHMFIQTGGFVAWVINRIGSFFGVSVSGYTTTASFPDAIGIIGDNIVRFIFPSDSFVSYSVLVGAILTFVIVVFHKKNYRQNALFLAFALFIPLFGFAIHTRPGSAYFPVIFPQLSIFIGMSLYFLIKRIRMLVLLFFILALSNIIFTIQHKFFLDIGSQKGAYIQDWNYGLGPSLSEQQSVIKFLKNDADGKTVHLRAGGFLRDFSTSLDNYRYLMMLHNIKESQSGVVYTVYQDRREVPENQQLIYRSENIFVTKHE